MSCFHSPSQAVIIDHRSFEPLEALPTLIKMEDEETGPHANDILMGRGGKNNQHVGNGHLRSVARGQRENYRLSSKKGKSQISRDIVAYVRNLDPPGRFLKKEANGEWEDVGDDVAREKVSQVLRDAVSNMQYSPKGSKAAEDAREETGVHQFRSDPNANATIVSPVYDVAPPQHYANYSSPENPRMIRRSVYRRAYSPPRVAMEPNYHHKSPEKQPSSDHYYDQWKYRYQHPHHHTAHAMHYPIGAPMAHYQQFDPQPYSPRASASMVPPPPPPPPPPERGSGWSPILASAPKKQKRDGEHSYRPTGEGTGDGPTNSSSVPPTEESQEEEFDLFNGGLLQRKAF